MPPSSSRDPSSHLPALSSRFSHADWLTANVSTNREREREICVYQAKKRRETVGGEEGTFLGSGDFPEKVGKALGIRAYIKRESMEREGNDIPRGEKWWKLCKAGQNKEKEFFSPTFPPVRKGVRVRFDEKPRKQLAINFSLQETLKCLLSPNKSRAEQIVPAKSSLNSAESPRSNGETKGEES